MKADEAARQDLGDLGEAFVGGQQIWLQRVHDQSPWWRRNMIALHPRENAKSADERSSAAKKAAERKPPPAHRQCFDAPPVSSLTLKDRNRSYRGVLR